MFVHEANCERSLTVEGATAPRHARYAADQKENEGGTAVLGTILIIIVILLLVGALPRWGYSSGWGYGPSGLLGLILIIVIILLLTGNL
jgi:uncharacterized membrane protein YkgB